MKTKSNMALCFLNIEANEKSQNFFYEPAKNLLVDLLEESEGTKNPAASRGYKG